MTTEPKRLYRSKTDRMFSGLCAGIGQYAGIDPTVVRVIFALSAIFAFPIPLIAYVAMMFIVPEEPDNPVSIIQS